MPDDATVSDCEVFVNMVFTNTGSTPVRTVNWFNRVGDIDGDIFFLSRDGQPVSYLGPLVKRGKPDAGDIITLEPGESVTRSVDLGMARAPARIASSAASPRRTCTLP